ncbi:Hpt domain-containing protein [Rhodopirellula halodulae]|uniref:Hpt domain-containing protein n=1 Tax=Rhodopirellula halodulae TaxID=2894198 RepID=UPI001E3CA07B|nr:Hpt domain-containing protein [Rhodopirellula sp. JC737]MCC9658886.1 Hpt domain-containing protein [Rhodopirellula sp. JC737]
MFADEPTDFPTTLHGSVGTYRLNDKGQLIDADDALLRFFGVQHLRELLKHADTAESVRPATVSSENMVCLPWLEDDPTLLNQIQGYFRRNLAPPPLQHKIKLKGRERWVLETLVPIRNLTGHLEQWLGSIFDLTAIQSRNETVVRTALSTADLRATQLNDLCKQLRWAIDRVRESVRENASACTMHSLLDSVDHLLHLEIDNAPTDRRKSFRDDKETETEPLSRELLKKVVPTRSQPEPSYRQDRRRGFRLCELLEDLAESVAPEIHRAGRRITVHVDPALPPVVRGNLQTIHCVLANLLHHAAEQKEFGDVQLIAHRQNRHTKFIVRIPTVTSEDGTFPQLWLHPDQQPSEWQIAARYAERLSTQLLTRFLANGHCEVSFETTLVEDKETESDLHLENRLDSHNRVLVLTSHAATRDTLTQILSSWKIQVTNCDELDVALQRIRVSQQMQRPFDAILIDEAIFANRQSLSTETLECLATCTNIRIQSRDDAASSNFKQRHRMPDWVWTVEEPIRQSCLRTALLGALSAANPDDDDCGMCPPATSHSVVPDSGLALPFLSANADTVAPDDLVESEPTLDESDLFNMESLRNECGGDDELSGVVMGILCQSLPARIREIQSAAHRGDYPAVRRLAHQIGGAAQDHSLSAVASLTLELKAHATSQDVPRVNECIQELTQRIDQTVDRIQALLEEAK